ncbi:NADH dehydrogenase (ubiquinone) B14.5 B subunit [Halictus rubicundus]|uniref:NADH dehydrogenase (ubiquinone) B14.5 B subunit n=1 Tax=Halictus rubicundus TaxID=77578 RepID=UPI0040375063
MGDESSIQWAIDIMTDKTHYKPSFLQKYRGDIGIIAALFASPVLYNAWRNIPLYSGFPQSCIYFSLPATFCALLATNAVRRTRAKRDARIVDYIKTYPERFPEPENKQFKDIFEPWVPIR